MHLPLGRVNSSSRCFAKGLLVPLSRVLGSCLSHDLVERFGSLAVDSLRSRCRVSFGQGGFGSCAFIVSCDLATLITTVLVIGHTARLKTRSHETLATVRAPHIPWPRMFHHLLDFSALGPRVLAAHLQKHHIMTPNTRPKLLGSFRRV